MKKILLFLVPLIFVASTAFATTVLPWENVSEVDGDFTVFYKNISGGPPVVVYIVGPGGATVPMCVLNTTTTSCQFKGPAQYMTAQIVGSGSAEVSWCGRVAP